MTSEPQVKLFCNGRNQAARIPSEFELDANVAIMRREDGRLIIEPLPQLGLLETLAGLTNLDLDFPDVESGLLPLDDPGLWWSAEIFGHEHGFWFGEVS